MVNPHGIGTTAFFQYGTTTSYGSTTSNVSAGSGSTDVAVNVFIGSLACYTLYHFRIVVLYVPNGQSGASAPQRTLPYQRRDSRAQQRSATPSERTPPHMTDRGQEPDLDPAVRGAPDEHCQR